MIRKPEAIAFWQGRLPHWEVEEGRYFVTIRCAGAIPESGCKRIHDISRQLLNCNRKDREAWMRIQRAIFREMEAWLDRGQHCCYLDQPEVAEMVMEALEHREARGDWHIFEYVIMPNHLHLFFELLRGRLKFVLEDFKRWTGHQFGKLLRISGERCWQREWFDHWSRSDEEDDRIMKYIRVNPEKALLRKCYLAWPYGSWRRSGGLYLPSGVTFQTGPAR